jgi:serine/threonine protein phosphatase PrpC
MAATSTATPLSAPRYQSALGTDSGKVRDHNEDRVWADDVRGCYAVIDGMGGHAAGERAAEIALERVRVRLERQTDSIEQRVREAITIANNAIYEAAQSKPEWNGMACVLTVAVVEKGFATIGHVGDSRLYKLKSGTITKITRDHSPVGEREDAGELTEIEAMTHPRRNEVFRDVGSREHTPDDADFIEIQRIPFEPESALLLCSDGLSDVIPSDQILEIVQSRAGDRWDAVQALIDAANDNSKDNVSAVLIEGEAFGGSKRKRATAAGPNFYRWAYLVVGLLLGVFGAIAAMRWLATPTAVRAPVSILVPELGSISAALDKALPGDTVVLSPGIYRETIHLKSEVDLIAQKAHLSTIEGDIVASGVTSARVQGLLIRADDVGISANDSNVNIARCEISGARTAGVQFTGSSLGSLSASSIHDNAGSGVTVAGHSSPDIENNLIIGNGAQPANLRPGLELLSTEKSHVTGNVFLSNGADAIWVNNQDPALLERNYFSVAGKIDKRGPSPVKVVGDKP